MKNTPLSKKMKKNEKSPQIKKNEVAEEKSGWVEFCPKCEKIVEPAHISDYVICPKCETDLT